MLRVDVSKNSNTALSSHEGAFVTSTTTSAPASALASPSPVMVLTPDEGDADAALWPRSRRRGISFFPMSPLPPITTIFIMDLLVCRPESGPLFEVRIDQRAARDRARLAFPLIFTPSRG